MNNELQEFRWGSTGNFQSWGFNRDLRVRAVEVTPPPAATETFHLFKLSVKGISSSDFRANTVRYSRASPQQEVWGGERRCVSGGAQVPIRTPWSVIGGRTSAFQLQSDVNVREVGRERTADSTAARWDVWLRGKLTFPRLQGALTCTCQNLLISSPFHRLFFFPILEKNLEYKRVSCWWGTWKKRKKTLSVKVEIQTETKTYQQTWGVRKYRNISFHDVSIFTALYKFFSHDYNSVLK